MSTNPTMPGNPAQQFGTILRRLTESRQWDRALEVARDWLSQDPENIEAHLGAAQSLINLKQYAAAQTHLGKVLAARPNYAFVFRLASIAAFHLNKTDKADEYIRRAIELQPNDAMNWYHMALMRYRQGLPEAAEKHAKRALELQPENADTINLIAICQRNNPQGQMDQYRRALEIDPQNAIVHMNIGVYYLNTAHDYAAAEAAFRRSLEIDPTDRTAQKNLFAVLRLRDPLYRVLTWPRTLLWRASWARRDRSAVVKIALLLLWLTIGRYFLVLIAVWLLLVWPLVKAYEYLTVSDIRAKAGMAGARRAKWRELHRWPVGARLGIFGLLVVCFWGGLFWLYESRVLPPEWIILAAVAALLAWYFHRIPAWWKRNRSRAAGLRAEKRYARQAKKAAAKPADP